MVSPSFLLQFRNVSFQPGKLVPGTLDEQQDGKFTAQYRHAAVGDVALQVEDGVGQLIHQTGTVLPQRGQNHLIVGFLHAVGADSTR